MPRKTKKTATKKRVVSKSKEAVIGTTAKKPAKAAKVAKAVGPGTAPSAFVRNPSRSIHSGSLVTMAPPIRSE